VELGWRGRPTPRQNHHLTLAFIGESDDIPALCRCMDAAAGPDFNLTASGLGRFPRQGGDTLWLAVRQEAQLLALQQRLADNLRLAGFHLENRPFRPHLTLMRPAVEPAGFDLKRPGAGITELHQHMDKMSLMKSERQDGRVVYTELYATTLGRPKVGGQ